MATRKELNAIDIKLSLIRNRLRDLYVDREELNTELQQKRLRADRREILEARLATLANQIKAAEKEEHDVDDQRYDLLYYPKR